MLGGGVIGSWQQCLSGRGLLVRRMLMMQDRAAIAKGLKEGCSLRRIADRIGRSVSVVSQGDTP